MKDNNKDDAANQIAFTLNDLMEVTDALGGTRQSAILAGLFRDACLLRGADMEADLFDEMYLEFKEAVQGRPFAVGHQPFRPDNQNQPKQKLYCEPADALDTRCKVPRDANTCCMDELEAATEGFCETNNKPTGSQDPGMIDAIVKGMGPQIEKLAEARLQALVKQHGLRRE